MSTHAFFLGMRCTQPLFRAIPSPSPPLQQLRPRLHPLPLRRSQLPLTRPFSASPTHSIDFAPVDTACTLAYHAIDTIHSTTGLSWDLTLPLTALLVRTLIVLPLNLRQQTQINKRLQLNPIIDAWKPALQEKVFRENAQLGPEKCHKLWVAEIKRKKDELYKRHGVSWGLVAGWLQLPVFLVFIETVRKMCGAKGGLLTLATSLFRNGVTTGVESAATNVPLVESFRDGGMLWFPDLMAADPHITLPFILSAAMMANVYYSGGRERLRRSGDFTRAQRGMTRGLMVLSLCLGPLTLHVPSAIMVYWIGSTGSALLQRPLVDRMRPKPVTARACKPRPLR